MFNFVRLFSHPLTKGISIDDPLTTVARREIIKTKPFLFKIYSEWYSEILSRIIGKIQVLEIGSGAGFLKEILPSVITSEVFKIDGVDLTVDACKLPFLDNFLDAIVMTDVFHHIPDIESFLSEATRCIKDNGKIVMVEPWNTKWSRFIFSKFHHEPFDVNGGWKIPTSGPLSGANGAIPWIVFNRDKEIFDKKFPQWSINEISPMMPFSYLISGGVSTRNLVPGFLYKPLRIFEKFFFEKYLSMFAVIELQKQKIKIL